MKRREESKNILNLLIWMQPYPGGKDAVKVLRNSDWLSHFATLWCHDNQLSHVKVSTVVSRFISNRLLTSAIPAFTKKRVLSSLTVLRESMPWHTQHYSIAISSHTFKSYRSISILCWERFQKVHLIRVMYFSSFHGVIQIFLSTVEYSCQTFIKWIRDIRKFPCYSPQESQGVSSVLSFLGDYI